MSEQLQEDLPKVIEEFEKKCEEHPNSVMAFHHLGLVYMKAGRIDDAIKTLKKAIKIDDLSSESMINLGAIYFGQGDLDKAQEMNEKAVAVNAEEPRELHDRAVGSEREFGLGRGRQEIDGGLVQLGIGHL